MVIGEEIHEIPTTHLGAEAGHLTKGTDCSCHPEIFERYISNSSTGLTIRHNRSIKSRLWSKLLK